MNALIVTCDDCGLSEGVNRAALSLFRRGMAGNASVLANFPATAHALDLLRAEPEFTLGVHLNLTEGSPLTAIPAALGLTAADGRFGSMATLVRRALVPSPQTLAAIAQELDAQCAVVARSGPAIRHLSTHLQFHMLPSLRRIVLRLAQTYRVAWVRTHHVSATVVPWNPLVSRTLARRAAAPAGVGADVSPADAATGPASPAHTAPDYLAVLRNWQGRGPEALARTLAGLDGTVELAVHPGLAADPGFPPYIGYGAEGRFAETEFFERCWPLLRHSGPRA